MALLARQRYGSLTGNASQKTNFKSENAIQYIAFSPIHTWAKRQKWQKLEHHTCLYNHYAVQSNRAMLHGQIKVPQRVAPGGFVGAGAVEKTARSAA
jgi:hypothetical protein